MAIERLAEETTFRTVNGRTISATARTTIKEVALSEPFQHLLREFSDVSPPKLLLGLPAVRSTDHAIELEPGSRPPAHRVYRLSPKELAELKQQL